MGRYWTGFLIAGVLAVIAMFFFTGESATTAGARFMAALSDRKVDTLTDMSYVEGASREEIEKAWKKCTDANMYYRFMYDLKGADSPKNDEALVRVALLKNVTSTSYEEVYTLKMFKKSGGWKIDVATLNRDIYPWLPRWNQ